MAQGLRDVAGLPDPVGEVVRGCTLANGLELRQVRVPFGVVGMIYEARPNVTADAAGICLKSGNAVLLRGSSSARSSNAAIVEAMRGAVARSGLPADVVQLVPGDSHDSVKALMRARGPRRRAHPARGSGPDPQRRRGVHRAGHRDRRRQLPRLRRRLGRPRAGARDRAQLQDPPHQRLQRRRVAPRARGRRRRVPAPRDRGAAGAGVTIHGDAAFAEYDDVVPGHRRGPRRPSTSPWTSPPPSSPTSRARSRHIRRWSSGHTEAIVTETRRRPGASSPPWTRRR